MSRTMKVRNIKEVKWRTKRRTRIRKAKTMNRTKSQDLGKKKGDKYYPKTYQFLNKSRHV